MQEGSRAWAWGGLALVGCFAACSSSGVVLETRRGDPSPHDSDAGAVSTDDDAGPPKGVDPTMLRSGSRIHVRGQVADGDFIALQGLYDTVKDVDCYIHLADDGVARCLPDFGGGSVRIVYADADCTEPLLRVNAGSAPCYGPPVPPPYIAVGSRSACPQSQTSSIFTPGAQIEPPAQLYDTANSDGTCQPSMEAIVGTSGAAANIYTLNPSPASDWVAFQKAVKPLTSRLGIIQWSGSDGTLMTGDTVLLSNDAQCGPGGGHYNVTPETASWCIPSNVQYIYNGNPGGPYFSDAMCSAGVAVVPDCEPPELLVESTPGSDSCSNGTQSYFLPGDVLSSTVYTNQPPAQPGSCSPAGDQVKAYAKGAPVDPSTYPPMQMVLTGTGRIRHYEWQSEGVSISSAGNLADAMTGAAVAAQSFADGGTLGAFSTTTTEKFFSDPGCKTWLYAGYTDEYSSQNFCSTPPVARWVVFQALPTPATLCDNSYTYQSSVRPVLGKHTGKVYTLIPDLNVEMNGACSEYVPSKTKANGIYDFYDLGNPISARSLFAEIKSVDL